MPALTQRNGMRRPPGATGTPGGWFSDGLDDLATSQAARADTDPLGAALHDRPPRHQVRQPPARGDIVRVADLVAHDGPFPTHITALGHASGLLGRDGLGRRRGPGTGRLAPEQRTSIPWGPGGDKSGTSRALARFARVNPVAK